MPAQEDYTRFSEIADELGLEDTDKENFVNSAMKRKGYKPSTAWNDPEPEESDEGEEDFFSSRKKKKQQQQQEQKSERKASGGGFGGYGYDN